MKTKVLILQNQISSYNVSTYNRIAFYFDLTLGYYTKDQSGPICDFKKIKLDTCNIKSLTFVSGLRDLCNNYDVVIIMPDMHVVSYCLLAFGKRKYKVISWSIGFRVSYEHPYTPHRKHILPDWVFKKVLQACDANIFYMNKSKEFWKKSNLRMDNIFEAINTTDVVKIELRPELKKDFLFVGTLYKGKGLDLLLDAFNKVIKEHETETKLRIVGAGSERETLEKYVEDNGLQDKVVFHGAIYDENEISKIFQQSLLCFSPTQAGLSVPKSMGYGVPFVTRQDAITGGEIYHITPNINGVIYESDRQLPNIMKEALQNRGRFIEMGQKAIDYYYQHATINHMSQGAINAINFVLDKNNL